MKQPTSQELAPTFPTIETEEARPDSLRDIPCLVEVGADDPLERTTTAFPDRSYHAFKVKGTEFVFNEFFAGGNRGVGNEIYGPGLYCGKSDLARKYQNKLGAGAGVAEILPWQARLIDTTHPDFTKPPSVSFMKRLSEYVESHPSHPAGSPESRAIEKLLAKERPTVWISLKETQQLQTDNPSLSPSQLETIVKRYNTRLNLAHFLNPKSNFRKGFGFRQLFQDTVHIVQSVDGLFTFDEDIVRSFLVEEGVDGLKYNCWPSVDPNTIHEAVVYWRLDRIGDKETWKKRQRAYGVAGAIGAGIAKYVEKSSDVKIERVKPDVLAAKTPLTKERANQIIDDLNDRQRLVELKDGLKLWAVLGQPKVDPLRAVTMLAEANPKLAELLRADVGVWERYKLHEHTQAVLGQFERFYAPRIINGDPHTRNFGALIRTVLLLQDIGKSLAVAAGAGKDRQARYNRTVSANILRGFPMTRDVKKLVLDLIGQDLIGTVMKHPSSENIQKTGAGIKELARKHEGFMSLEDLFQVMQILNACDASAYTAHASYFDVDKKKRVTCKPSLEHLFEKADRSAQIRFKPAYMRHLTAIYRVARQP